MAISFDATSYSGLNAGGSTHTFSHTTSGSDRYLFVHVISITTYSTVSGITYNGSSMTLLEEGLVYDGTYFGHLYGIVNPASGAHDVVVTFSEAVISFEVGFSYNGVHQTTPINASDYITHAASASPTSFSLTTSVANCWLVMYATGAAGYPSADSGTTYRDTLGVADGDSTSAVYDSNAGLSAGANSLNLISGVDPDDFSALIVALEPSGGSAVNSGFLSFM